MCLAAIETPDGMGAWEPFSRQENGGIQIGVPLAAARKSTVVLLAVRPRAGGTPALWGGTSRLWVAPAPAARAEGHARISPGCPKASDIPTKLDGLSEQGLSPGTADRVRDVQVDRGHVRLW
jgi:hypothetical protein